MSTHPISLPSSAPEAPPSSTDGGPESGLPRVRDLKRQTILIFTFLFLLTLLVVMLWTWLEARKVVSKGIDDQLAEALERNNRMVELWLNRVADIVRAAGRLAEEDGPERSEELRGHLRALGRHRLISELYIGTEAGAYWSNRWEGPPRFDPRIRPWYRAARERDGLVICDPFSEVHTQDWVVSVAMPLRGTDRKVWGVLSADVQLRTLADLLGGVRFRNGAEAFLLDRQGLILVHPDNALMGKSGLEHPVWGPLFRHMIGTGKGRLPLGPKGEQVVLYTHMQGPRWIQGVVLNRRQIYEPLDDLAWRYLLVLGLCLLLLGVVAHQLTSRLTLFTRLMEKTLEVRTAELRYQVEEVARLSVTDPLTGLANRRRGEQYLEQSLALCRRSHQPLAVILSDLDWFKQVNDRLGHRTGDRVLRQTAGILAGHVRQTDLVVRWGGEEFLVVCPHADQEGVAALAEKLRQRVEEQAVEGGGLITLSLGWALAREGEGVEDLVARADQGLYLAKQKGRNRVESLEPSAMAAQDHSDLPHG